MEQGCTATYSKLIDKLLIQDLSPGKMSELRGHMGSCPACQHRYNRVVLASRLLDGGPDALELPSERELGWVEQAVLQRARLIPDPAPARRSVVKWVVGFAAAAAAIAIAVPLTLKSRPPTSRSLTTQAHPPEFSPRGVPAKISPQVGVRALCLQKHQPTAVETKVLDPTLIGTCRVNDILRFAYTNKSKMDYLFLVGVDGQYRIKWYEPHPPKRESIKVLKGEKVVDKMLSRAVNLKVNHGKGQMRLFAIFSAKPLRGHQIEQAVASAKKARTPIEQLEMLQVEDTEQRSILVNLSESDDQ